MPEEANPPPTLHSRRNLSLRFDVPISKTSRFWQALEEGRLVTTKCSNCGTLSFPPQADCPNCMSGEAAWVDLGNEAELLTFTSVQIIPTSFVDHDPYVVAIARLARERVNVLAWLEGVEDPSKLKVGAKLKLVVRKSEDGNPYYVFVPSP